MASVIAQDGAVVDPLKTDVAAVKRRLVDHLVHSVGQDPVSATPRDWFVATAYLVRDHLTEEWLSTRRRIHRPEIKRVYYLSVEYLVGRFLLNNLINTGLFETVREALADYGLSLSDICEQEWEAALGNGGLGRLAACFLDSLATLGLPGTGYGIRYEFGMFKQAVESGAQVEHPENWLRYGNPWEFPRPELLYPVRFGGRTVEYVDEHGHRRHQWLDGDEVLAMAYDITVAGYGDGRATNLRLWTAKSTREFSLAYFNEGNYIQAVQDKTASETLSKVLYPSDNTSMGRELRLKQEYFFVSSSIQDILRRFRRRHDDWRLLPERVAIQLNDTHPALAIPELMRLLLDQHGLEWDVAWDLTRRTFAYTNHTLLPEALETWPLGMFEALLPRHLQIIYDINQRFLQEVRHRWPGDEGRVRAVSLIDEDNGRRVRMAHLAFVGSHKVNGVSAIHTELMRTTIFADLHALYPDRIINVTNGITPRRWLDLANPGLAHLITERIGSDWLTDLDQLRRLEEHADDPEFRTRFGEVKRANKERLADLIARELKIIVSPDALFDVHVKRIHEYKRQLLNVLHVVTLYNRIRLRPDFEPVPRVVIFAGKSAPGYVMAKNIIRLINAVGDVVNNDPAVRDLLKVVFVPDYNVSKAEMIMPAADLSQQISTAGTEASGTGNMKLALNGALTIGTRDGANIEIGEAVGEDNVFFFGLDAAQAAALKHGGYDPWRYYRTNPELRRVIDMIAEGYFSPEQPDLFRPISDSLTFHGDPYLLLADYASYVACQEQAETTYRDRGLWTRKAILNVARVGRFSADRTIEEYAESIWRIAPLPPC